MDKVEIKKIEFDSKQYWECVRLRERVLRLPIFKRFEWSDLMTEKEELIYAAIVDSRIIGTMQFVEKNGIYKMRQVAIDKNFQGKNIGSRLIEFTEQSLKKPIEKIYCHARITAVNFYKKNKYKIIGDIFMEVGIEHYLMEKEF